MKYEDELAHRQSDMNYHDKLAQRVRKLKKPQALELRSKLNDASIAFELGQPWRPIFQIMKNKYPIGEIHRIYTALAEASPEQMNKVSLAMATLHFGDENAA